MSPIERAGMGRKTPGQPQRTWLCPGATRKWLTPDVELYDHTLGYVPCLQVLPRTPPANKMRRFGWKPTSEHSALPRHRL